MTTPASRESAPPLVQAPESIRALFRARFTRDIAAAREALPDHPYWQAYDGDLRFADLCADALVGYVAKALQSQPALYDQVLERLLANVADWPVGVGINVADPALRLEPAFVAASNVAILSEVAIGRKTGWPGDAAPNDVLRWMSELGDNKLRSFARELLERDDWLPVAIKDQGNGTRTVTIDANGYRVMGFAHVYVAWRDVVNDARTALGAARVAWVAVRDSSDETLAIMARGALEQANHPPTDEEAVRELIASLRAGLPLALDASGFTGGPPLTEEDAIATEAGVLRWDEGFARYLEHLGDQGNAIARVVRDKARDRFAVFTNSERSFSGGALWALWADIDARPVCLRFGRTLAYALWLERVREHVYQARRKPPALVMAVAEPVAHLFSRVRREEEINGQRALRLPGEVLVRVSKAAAAIGSETIDALMVNRGVKLFGSLASHRVLRWQIFTAHKQALEHNPDPRVLRIDGGWSTLARDVLGMKGKRAVDEVRAIVEAMHVTELPLPPHGDYSRLLIREAHTPRGRGSHWIKLVLGTALLPDYVHELQQIVGGSLDGRRATRLVPVLEIPPVIGRDNEHGAQATMSMLLVAHLRDHALELVEHGGVTLDKPTILEMAERAGLAAALVNPLLDRWTHDGDDGPALLKTVGPDRYTLGDAHAVQRRFIEDGARREVEGRKAGIEGAKRRRAQLSRAGKASA